MTYLARIGIVLPEVAVEEEVGYFQGGYVRRLFPRTSVELTAIFRIVFMRRLVVVAGTVLQIYIVLVNKVC